MQSLSFTPGRAFLSVNSPIVPWTVVFEDEGVAGYFYACDRSQEVHEHSILDAMLIYNVAALAKSDAELQRPEPQRIAIGRVVPRRPAGRALPRRHRPGPLRLPGPLRVLPHELPQLHGRAGRYLAQIRPCLV